jgi:hypothetical protein
MIKLNENYVVTPTGAKTLIIEEGDDWNKVCELEVSLIISLYLKNLSLLFSSANNSSRKTDR